MFFVLFNFNRQVALHICTVYHGIHYAFPLNYEMVDRVSHFALFDMYCGRICANYRLVLTFAMEHLLIYCRLTADVRVETV